MLKYEYVLFILIKVMVKKFGIIGLGQFGSAIAKVLYKKGAEVIAIDNDPQKVEHIKDYVTYAVELDATDKNALTYQNIEEVDVAIVSIGENFECLILTTFILKELGIKKIVSRAQNEDQRKILTKIGITDILSPEEEVANSLATRLINPNFMMHFSLPGTGHYEIVEVKAPKKIIGRNLRDIKLREKYSINLITLVRKDFIKEDQNTIGVPTPETTIQDGDLIFIFGQTKAIERFISINE